MEGERLRNRSPYSRRPASWPTTVLPLTLMSTEEYPFISNIVTTLREFGDATSRNLEFSHRPDVYVSYGEETITGTNLLEIRRRHSDRVHLETFSKKKEAHSGADWEWHIVGKNWTLKMRVQAKRTQYKKGRLRIKYNQQRKLLLTCARAANMRPMYCIYCTEPQRSFWTQSHPDHGSDRYQTGCLMADANNVPETTTKLCRIERKCFPWHFLLEGGESWWDGPTIADLNEKGDGKLNRTGVHATYRDDLDSSRSRQEGPAKTLDSRTHRKLVMDVRVRE